MSYNHKYKKGEYVQTQKEQTETVKDVLSFPFMDLPDRKIRKETCERFGVRVGLSPEDGKTICAVYFPSLNQKGKIVGYMRADLTKNKEDKGYWTAVGSVTISNKLFGQDVAESIQRKRNNLVITEGPWDMLSVAQAQVDSVANTKYKGMEPFVVSIPLGTKNAVEAVLHNLDVVKSFEGVTIFFDNDVATPGDKKQGIARGREAREAVAGSLVGTGIKLFSVEAKGEYKDASDYLQNDDDEQLAKLVQFERKVFTPEKILKASDITLDEILAPRPEGINVPEFPKLMDKIHGLRQGEFVLITSPTGVGKSSTSFILSDAVVKADKKVGMIFLEETVVETKRRFLSQMLKVNYLEFNSDPIKAVEKRGMTRDDIAHANEALDNSENICFLNHFGSMPITDLMNKVRYLHFVEGCDFIFLDHISLLVSGERIEDERKELDIVCTELASFCAANNCGIIAVSHLNRSISEGFKPPKGKENEDFWVRVTASMMRGSAALEQLSFVILGLEPEIKADRTRGRVRWVVLKNRPWSYLGEADTFTIDNDTWEVRLDETASF